MSSLAAICIYPVKSCAGTSVRRARVTKRGLVGDRRYMIVDDAGRFFTQREEPGLQNVRPVWGDGGFRLTTAAGEVAVPSVLDAGQPCEVQVWDSTCAALVHAPGSELLSELFARPLRLVYMPDTELRAVDPDYGRADDIVSFADGFPLLLLNEASLAELNRHLPRRVGMDRFRGNVIVDGASAYQEDALGRVKIGELEFRSVKPCSRCAVVNVDPARGVREDREPLSTLVETHAPAGKPLFGANLIPESEGEIEVGARVTLPDG